MFAFVMAGSLHHECAGLTGEAHFAAENRIGNMDYELATAARHVAKARRIVARQRARVVRLRALGRATFDQELTLRAFVSSLAHLESGAQALADTAKRFDCRQHRLS